jgi:hypothetical protein
MQIENLTNTGTSLYDLSSAQQRQLWSRVADIFEKNEDPFQTMEGGPEGVIETITDTSKGKGHKINFGIRGRIFNKPKLGEERFTATTDYAKVTLGNDTLTVDFVRNASSESLRAEQHMGMVGELLHYVPQMLGEWMGWYKSKHTQMTILHKINPENIVLADATGAGHTDVNDLTSNDVPSWNEFVDMAAMLEPLGGTAAMVGTDEMGNSIFGTCNVLTVPAIQALKKDSTYIQNLQQAGERGSKNKLFDGGLTMLDGHCFKKFKAVDHADEGPIGCPLTPKAMLGVAIASGTAAVDIKGGGSAANAALTHIEYMEDFPLHDYRFRVDDVLSGTADFWGISANSDKFYVVIVNPKTAATDPGKYGMYRVSANDGHKLTTDLRLAAAISGTAHTTVGDITWDANIHTDVHPVGSLVYLANSHAIPLMATPMLLNRALRRGYGMERNKRTEDKDEGGFGLYTYIRTVFGQEPRKDRSGRVPGIGVLIHTGTYEGWNCPTWDGT